jgi:RNAse (barnase) inhibitor barstar
MDASELPVLVIDLRREAINSWDDLWKGLSVACALPDWFGRNLDAWWDTIQARRITDLVDAHFLVIRVAAEGLFATGQDGDRFVEMTNISDYARAEIVGEDTP